MYIHTGLADCATDNVSKGQLEKSCMGNFCVDIQRSV